MSNIENNIVINQFDTNTHSPAVLYYQNPYQRYLSYRNPNQSATDWWVLIAFVALTIGTVASFVLYRNYTNYTNPPKYVNQVLIVGNIVVIAVCVGVTLGSLIMANERYKQGKSKQEAIRKAKEYDVPESRTWTTQQPCMICGTQGSNCVPTYWDGRLYVDCTICGGRFITVPKIR
jgi:hypothetical protein